MQLAGAGNYIEIIPSYSVFDNMLPELINELGITNEITVIYDEEYQNSIEYDWRRPFENLNVSVRFERAEESPQLTRAHLNRLGQTTKFLLFLTDTLTVESYVFTAQREIEANLWTWLVFSKDQLPFKCFECENAQIYWIRIAKSTNNEILSSLAEFIWPRDLDAQFLFARKARNQLRTAYCLDIMYQALSYMIVLNKTRTNNVDSPRLNKTIAELLERKVDYDFGKYIHHGENLYYQSTRAIIIKIDRMSRFDNARVSKYIGNWTLEDGIRFFYPGKLRENVRSSTHYRIVTIVQEPYIQDDGPNSTLGYRGYCIDLLEIIQKELNFTYELYLVPDRKFGILDQSGLWNGMIGELMSGQADIALGPISVTNERDADIDFTESYYSPVGTTILMKKKDPGYSMFKFLMVLEPEVWASILGCYLFTSVLLWVFERFSPYSYTNQREKHKNAEEVKQFTLRECLWFCISSLTLQGGGEAPRNISGRLVAATWWLFGFIVIASYTANLAVFLAVSRMEKQITGLDDLATQYKVKYAPLKDGSTETYFRRMEQVEKEFYGVWKQISFNESMTDEERKRANVDVWDYPVSDKYTNIWRFMKHSDFPRTVDEAIQRVKTSEDGFAFIGDSMDINYAALMDCTLQQIGQEFSHKSYAIAVQAGSRLGSEISPIITKLIKDRELEKIKRKWWHRNPKRPECAGNDGDQTGISIRNIGGVFILILGGIFLSLGILIVEFLQYKRKISMQK